MENFCYNAFVGLDINPAGDIKPCCKFLSNNIPRFNLKQGIDSYKKSPWLKKLQKDFLQNKKPAGCERCWKEEKAGIESKRQIDYQKYSKKFKQINLEKPKFINISLSFGNICNLACRICSPASSSRWASEKNKVDKNKKYPIYNWFNNKKIMNDIYKNTKDAIHIDIPGGEPLLLEISEHFEYLQKFKKHQAKEISLHYTTNGTTFPKPKFIDLWSRFKKIDIQLSIDDINERFEYNRWPARWKNVYENIKKFKKLCKNKKYKLSISFSISAFTILYAEDFFKWCVKEGLPAPWMGLVSKPLYYSPSVFPKPVLKKIKNKLEKSKIKEIVKLKKYVEYEHSQYFDQFLKIVQQLDLSRKQKFQKTFPELAEILRY